jgi:hypothetical protein
MAGRVARDLLDPFAQALQRLKGQQNRLVIRFLQTDDQPAAGDHQPAD